MPVVGRVCPAYSRRRRLFRFHGVSCMTEKRECFLCKRMYFVDDPEFDAERCICDSCAEELDRDNPYTYYCDYDKKESE